MSLRTKEEVSAYLSTHDLQAHMQQALQHVVNEQTPEPLLVLSKFFAAKHADVVKAAYDEAGADRRGDSRWPLGEIFMQFDTDNDGFLNESEFKRALRAIGLPKRTGSQAQLDEFTFRLMDTNKDGVLSVQEFEANLPLALRAKLEAKLDAGWKFDEEKWKASQERHKTTNLAKVFKMFDTEGRGTISDGMLKRAFRALGLKKRSGDKLEMDEAMFKTFDTNGDGVVSLQEFEANCPPAVRALIIEKLEGGWKFDPELWKESMNRHRTVNFAKIFKNFDMDGDGCLDFREMQRAFRAMGIKKRAGANYELDAMTFKRFDANGDGKVSLQEFNDNMPDALRDKLIEIIEGGWTFNPDQWAASMERHANDEPFDPTKSFMNQEPIEVKYPMGEIFMQFDTDGDGVLNESEFKRAIRAIGLEKRTGDKANLDEFTFKQIDKNGDGKLTIEEFDAYLPLALRAKLEEKLAAGWKFDEEKWKASQERHAKWNLVKVFSKFDDDNDGALDMGELKRAFRAIGLAKRTGEKYELDEATFKSFDTNGDGKVSIEELSAKAPEGLRQAIEEKLNSDWKFDPDMWKASQARHGKTNYAKVFKLFDADKDGVLDMRELRRAFRAMGLKKRDGAKYDLDIMTFKAIDSNGDGKISLQEFETNMPQPLRDALDEAYANGWEFDPEKWQASLDRHKDDAPFESTKAYK